MPDVPTIAHVTLTVSDLDRSVQWYERLFDVVFTETKALARFDELSGSSKARRSSGFMSSPTHPTPCPSMSVELVWTICPSPVGTETSLGCGKPGCQNSVSAMVGSSDASYGSALSFRDPDNIALEFFTPAL